jgi:Zn-dependent peptidase ImmA (M78 family)
MIPEEETKKNSISLSTVVKIEQFYGCSRTALLYRLKSLGLITSEEYEIFNKNIKLSALLNGYNTKLYEKGHELEIIGDYGEKARRLFDNEKISESHYLTLLKDIGIEIPEMNE